jgi:dihydroxy-acid dehydratase
MDVFEGVRAYSAGRISAEALQGIESRACPGAGGCGGRFTANTMATVFEISPMGEQRRAGRGSEQGPGRPFDPRRLIMDLLLNNVTPRQIFTRKAMENAGPVSWRPGSANAVLHLLAVPRKADVCLSLADFDRISRKIPLLADLKRGAASLRRRCIGRGGWAWWPGDCWMPAFSTRMRAR